MARTKETSSDKEMARVRRATLARIKERDNLEAEEERIAYIKVCKSGGNDYSWFVKADGEGAKEELYLQSFVGQNFGRHDGLIDRCLANEGKWHVVPCEQISKLKYAANGKWYGKAAGVHKEWELLDFDSFVKPNFGVEDDGVFLAHCQAKPGRKRSIPPGKVTTRSSTNATRGGVGKVTAELALDCTGVARPQPWLVDGSVLVVKYQQGNDSTCVFSSAASAIYASGDELAAKSLASHANESITTVDRMDFLQQTVRKELKGWDVPKVLVGGAAAAFDCLAIRSPYPACIQIHGSDGSTDHCITTLGDWIFDSNKSHALPLCQASLDQCVDLGGEGVTFMGCAKVVKLVPSKKLLAVLGKRKRQSV